MAIKADAALMLRQLDDDLAAYDKDRDRQSPIPAPRLPQETRAFRAYTMRAHAKSGVALNKITQSSDFQFLFSQSGSLGDQKALSQFVPFLVWRGIQTSTADSGR